MWHSVRRWAPVDLMGNHKNSTKEKDDSPDISCPDISGLNCRICHNKVETIHAGKKRKQCFFTLHSLSASYGAVFTRVALWTRPDTLPCRLGVQHSSHWQMGRVLPGRRTGGHLRCGYHQQKFSISKRKWEILGFSDSNAPVLSQGACQVKKFPPKHLLE